jgi:hypothetical protein
MKIGKDCWLVDGEIFALETENISHIMNDMTFAYFCIVIYFMGTNITKIISGTTFVFISMLVLVYYFLLHRD